MPEMSESSFPNLALLVIDAQAPFIKAIDWPHDYLKRLRFSIAAARLLNIPVVFTEQVPEELGPTDPTLLKAAGESPTVFPKRTFSALQAQGLQDYLHTHHIEHLLIGGLEIPVCVYQSCIDAQHLDLEVTVLADTVAGRRVEDCCTVEHSLRAFDGVHWLPSETVFYSLLSSIEHPLFKAFTALVKAHAC